MLYIVDLFSICRLSICSLWITTPLYTHVLSKNSIEQLQLVQANTAQSVVSALSIGASSLGLTQHQLCVGQLSKNDAFVRQINNLNPSTTTTTTTTTTSTSPETKTTNVLQEWSTIPIDDLPTIQELTATVIDFDNDTTNSTSNKNSRYQYPPMGKNKNIIIVVLRLDAPNESHQPFGIFSYIYTSTISNPATLPASILTMESLFQTVATTALYRTFTTDRETIELTIHKKVAAVSNTGILAVDLNGRVHQYNEGMVQRVGWTKSEVQAKGWTRLVYPNPIMREQIEKGIATLIMSGTQQHTMTRTFTKKNGRSIDLEVVSFSIVEPDSKSQILVGLFKPNYDKTNTTFNQEIDTIESTVEQLVGPSDPKQPEKGSLTLQVGEINNPIGRRLLDENRNTVRNIKKEMSNNNNVSIQKANAVPAKCSLCNFTLE